jgi:hypothetical protein
MVRREGAQLLLEIGYNLASARYVQFTGDIPVALIVFYVTGIRLIIGIL